MKKQILLLATLLALLTSCGTRAPHYDYRELAQAALRLDMDIDMDDNHRLYIESAHWIGVPYRSGGTTRRGVDCSGFVVVTMRDRFDLQLPRETKQQASIGTQIDKDELLPGDLVFFKTGSGQNGLHVGIYDTNNQFIHASTSKGVMRSSLDNVYWQKNFWQARRI